MFTRISIPTPFQVGPVNAYIAGRTLVDPGPESEEAWSALLDALEERELAPGDVERVLITHPHPDHFGLARRLADAGARVCASPETADIVGDFTGRLEYEQDFFTDFFERCGMARATAETVTELPEAFLRYAPSVETDRELSEGDTLVIRNREVDIAAVTGHAAGELLFAYDEGDERWAVVGDNVLADITPNPFLLPPETPGGERPRVLPTYNDSLKQLRERDYGRFLPGHREVIRDPADRIDEILAAHEQRTEEVTGVLDRPMTPVDVMGELFGDLPLTEYFAGISEAVGHLDVLEARELATLREKGGVLVYEPLE
jgi:glyoxylase-like metal-dependent hydrolase (beta-lactamase superfamily II)